MYSRHDIALLDDVMSALDAQTQEMIIQRLLSHDGIFRQLGTTVVLTTHNRMTPSSSALRRRSADT